MLFKNCLKSDRIPFSFFIVAYDNEVQCLKLLGNCCPAALHLLLISRAYIKNNVPVIG